MSERFSEINLEAVIFDPHHVEDLSDCERAAHRLRNKVFNIDLASSVVTDDPEKLANALCFVANELGSK